MESQTRQWTKDELEIYILLLCANADSVITQEEVDSIGAKFNSATFDKIYEEFKDDSEDDGLKKIEHNICHHEYSHKELSEIRSDMKTIFYADNRYSLMERNMERILNRILY